MTCARLLRRAMVIKCSSPVTQEVAAWSTSLYDQILYISLGLSDAVCRCAAAHVGRARCRLVKYLPPPMELSLVWTSPPH